MCFGITWSRRGYYTVEARIVGNARLRQHRGGIRSWPSVRRDIAKHLKEDPGCIATTMVDYYGLPQTGEAAWPGRAEAGAIDPRHKGSRVEKALLDDMAGAMGGGFNPQRLIPFVVVHEFEALLFSDCAGFSRAIALPDLEPRFKEIRDQFETPEDINDSSETSPSHRVEALVPGYSKPLFGTLAVIEIGLARMRAECPHFDNWLKRLESLVG